MEDYSNKIKKLPDGSITYTLKELKEKKFEIPDFLVEDLILILLYAQPKPIMGRTQFMKEIFLLYDELKKAYKLEDGKFVKYRYGPYSFHIMDCLEYLEERNLVRTQGRKNSNSEKISLTEEGKKLAERIFARLREDIRGLIIEKRKGWDQLGTRGILNYVYQKFPEYIERSGLKEKYKIITWGRARG